MTTQQALNKAGHSLENEILLAHILRKERSHVIAHKELKLSVRQRIKFFYASKRLQKGYPLAYLLGFKPFYGSAIWVNRDVLIPRPETEYLMDQIKAAYDHDFSGIIVDVGTGSGAIALSLKKMFPKAAIVGLDQSR